MLIFANTTDGIREYGRELHAEALTAKQIRDRLAAGHVVTGQKWPYTKEHIYQILKRLGLRPNSPRTAMAGVRQQIEERTMIAA